MHAVCEQANMLEPGGFDSEWKVFIAPVYGRPSSKGFVCLFVCVRACQLSQVWERLVCVKTYSDGMVVA